MDQTLFLTIVGSVIMIMLIVIGWFLRRIADQYDAAQASHNQQFDKLLKKFDVLTEIIYEHKTDVEVIKEQISTQKRELIVMNNLFERVRVVENEITGIKARGK